MQRQIKELANAIVTRMIRILVAQISSQSTPVEQERATTSLLALTRSAEKRVKITAAGGAGEGNNVLVGSHPQR